MMRALFAAVLSGLALALYARAEWPWLLLGWVALLPWLAALDRVKSIRGAFLAGLFMSEALVATCCYWFPSAIHDYSGMPWGICLFVVLLIAPLLEPQFVIMALVRRIAGKKAFSFIPLAPIAGACAYVGAEWAIPKLFPVTLGHPLYGSTLLRQWADLTGVSGLTFIILLANDCVLSAGKGILSIFTGEGKRRCFAPLACLAVLVIIPSGYGTLRLRQLAAHPTETDAITVGIVQAGFSHYDRLASKKGPYNAVQMVLDTHEALSMALLSRGGIDLLVWPETVYPLTFNSPESEDGAAFDLGIKEFVMGTGVPLVFGAYDTENGRRFNAAFFLEPPGSNGDGKLFTYRKTCLFPLTEKVPSIFDKPAVRSRMPWLGTWTPGPGAKAVPLELAGDRSVEIAPLICYDALSPAQAIAAVRAGGDVILTLSNDSWLSYDHVPRLILIISAFRSIETRRPQVRATNTGISAVITPAGDIADMLDMNQRGVLVGSVRPGRGTTLMLLWGDWFGPTALAAAVLMLCLILSRKGNA